MQANAVARLWVSSVVLALPISSAQLDRQDIQAGPPVASAWEQVLVAGPSPRHSHSMAYDRVRQVTVLFGGLDGGSKQSTSVLGDTWEWDGTSWTQVASGGPSARSGHALVYDAANDVVLLFGGNDTTAHRNDTWTWNGTQWSQVASGGPPGRSRHAMAYDSARGVSVMFGGIPGDKADTWEWDGTSWTEVATTGPAGRSRHALAYDAAAGVTILFGGRIGGPSVGDTWAWDGDSWLFLADAGPLGRSRHDMVYDEERGVIVAFGGLNGPYKGDTLEWDGAQWTQVATTGPAKRIYLRMAYDVERRAPLLFGGWSGSAPLADTWEYVAQEPPPPGGNLLANPGFEELPDGAGWSGVPGTNRTIATSPVHSGAKSLAIVGSASAAYSVTQDVPVTAGADYDVSAWIKTSQSAQGARLRVNWRNGSGGNVATDTVGTLTGTQDWTELAATLAAPAGSATARVTLVLNRETDGASQAWFEDVLFGPP